MITCNGSGAMDQVAVGIDKRMRVLTQIPKKYGEQLRAYVEHRPELMKYPSVESFHVLDGDSFKTYILVGIDDKPYPYVPADDFRLARLVMAEAMKQGIKELAVMVDTLDADIPSFMDGLLFRNYEFNHYKTGQQPRLVSMINMVTSVHDVKKLNTLCYVYSAIYEGIKLARNLVNMPPNELTPRKFADIATALCKSDSLTVEVLNKWHLEKAKMGGILAVGRGSMNNPQLVTITYIGNPDSHERLAVVGKGITFDSGGLSLKSHENLQFMKSDMAGAATALGVMRALMLLKYPVNVVAVMPLAENVPSGMSFHVDDIITTLSGKTVEIKNTDAEGRLLLADGVTYAQKKGATKIIDLATLTGACVTALGAVRSGMLGNDQKWQNSIFEVAERMNERLWQLPTDREYEELLQSDVADLQNTGGRDAGAVTAGLFIKQFIRPGLSWVHLDIAGTAFVEKKDETGFLGATGVGVKTILELLKGGNHEG